MPLRESRPIFSTLAYHVSAFKGNFDDSFLFFEKRYYSFKKIYKKRLVVRKCNGNGKCMEKYLVLCKIYKEKC